MLTSFRFEPKPARVIFGAGKCAEIAKAVNELKCSRALVLSTNGQVALAKQIAAHLQAVLVGEFNGAVMHTPVEVTDVAQQQLESAKADCIVAVGGGSAIGLGKALALRTDLPQICIPTTYAGSEMTDILGETKDGAKTTQRSPKILPETVIYDPELTLALPAAVSATSGMNAIAHAVEALYAPDTNPVIQLMAKDGIRKLASSLPRIVAAPKNIDARTEALMGAWLCGLCLGNVSMALHHKLCHVLGGTFNLPHADTHTVLLPHATAYNSAAAPDAMMRIAMALGTSSAATGLHDLAQKLGAPTALKDIGMPEEGLDRAAEIAVSNPYPNPRPLERAVIRGLLDDAWHGHRPNEQR